MEGSIINRLKGRSKSGHEEVTNEPKAEERPPWSCVSLYREQFEVEIGDKKRVCDLEEKDLKEKIVELLSAEAGLGNEAWSEVLFSFLFEERRIGSCVDCYNSPYFGPNTRRISFVLDKHNIFYESRVLPSGRYKINAVGKRTIIDGVPIRATIRLVISIKDWGEEQVDSIRSQGLDWFCGSLG
ncbi:Matrix protein [Alphacytorhabdovirus alphapogostemi]|uniref:Matrix protein n=1 Tax=Patchouli chlorosis-associated cytorhabdovirus TaxID=2979813 RepID=A0A977PKU5_9RHAB|nr:Matrix protein [Patchouli chlorosis-associated cytorhabdovirus]